MDHGGSQAYLNNVERMVQLHQLRKWHTLRQESNILVKRIYGKDDLCCLGH